MPDFVVNTKCRHCNGAGKVPHPGMTELYGCLGITTWTTAARLAKRMRVSVNQALNLTAKLHDMGLIERRGNGNRHEPFEWRKRA